MEIQIDLHTLDRAKQRGANENEIKDVIDTGSAIPAKYGEQLRRKSMNLRKSGMANTMNTRGWRWFIQSKKMR